MIDQQTKTLVLIAVYSVLNKPRHLKRILSSRAVGDIEPTKVRETLLQVHLFAGFPASIEAFEVLRSTSPIRKTPTVKKHKSDPRKAGRDLYRKVYMGNYRKVMNHLNQLDPQLADWILGYGYGTVLNRRGLSLKEREVIAISILAALGWMRQLHSHIRGAVNVGVSSDVIREVLRITTPYISRPRVAQFKTILSVANVSENTRNA